MKTFTSIEQSKKLAEILPLDSADMHYVRAYFENKQSDWFVKLGSPIKSDDILPCWSLATLLSFIKDKCDYFEFVYLKRTYDGRATPLEDVYRLSTDVYDVYKKEAIDACYEMILKLHEQNIL